MVAAPFFGLFLSTTKINIEENSKNFLALPLLAQAFGCLPTPFSSRRLLFSTPFIKTNNTTTAFFLGKARRAQALYEALYMSARPEAARQVVK